MFYSLPHEVVLKVYEYDSTYHEVFTKVLHQIHFKECVEEMREVFELARSNDLYWMAVHTTSPAEWVALMSLLREGGKVLN